MNNAARTTTTTEVMGATTVTTKTEDLGPFYRVTTETRVDLTDDPLCAILGVAGKEIVTETVAYRTGRYGPGRVVKSSTVTR